MLAQLGIAVTDNGTCFTSAECEEFLARNGNSHRRSVPYHPASNGLAERAVRVLKQGLKKIPAFHRLTKLLFAYRKTQTAQLEFHLPSCYLDEISKICLSLTFRTEWDLLNSSRSRVTTHTFKPKPRVGVHSKLNSAIHGFRE